MFFLFDIIAGITLTHLVGLLFGFDPSVTHVLIGIVFALLPDLDFAYHYLRTSQVSAYKGHIEDHRDGLHYPLLYLPIGSGLTWLLFGEEWAVLFFLGSLSHFLHDSVGIGWGIKWLFPFTSKNYKFFCEKDGELSNRLVVSWTQRELTEVISAKGDKNWIANLFWKPIRTGRLSVMLVVEFAVPLLLILGYVFWRFW
jgi:hypothetical protein